MDWIDTTKAVVELAPSVLTLIQKIEQLFGEGHGPEKKAVVMASVATASPAITEAVSALVNTTVAKLNISGVFAHGQTVAPPGKP